jgi:glycosyl transferase, family 25
MAQLSQHLRRAFDRVYILNLPDRADRRREATAEFDRVGVDIDNDFVRFFNATRPGDDGGFGSLGIHGCYLSHLAALKQSVADGLGRVLICEDDFSFNQSFRDHAANRLAELPARRWDVVHVGHGLNLTGTEPAGWHAAPAELAILLAHCYGVSGSIAPRLIETLEAIRSRKPGHPLGGPMHYDGALTTFRAQNADVVTLYSTPNLVGQRSSRSDITPGLLDRWPLRPVTGVLRKLLKSR